MRALARGDRVAVVSCSGPFEREAFDRGVAWCRERVHLNDDPRWYGREGYLAGRDEQRAAALIEALEDPDVRAVIAARGGYGAMRVLERVGSRALAALARDPKPVVGFSDVTALHAAWAKAGVRSLHASMVGAYGRGEGSPEAVWGALSGALAEPWEGLRVMHRGAVAKVEARALGGNLALVTALAASPWRFDLAGAALFLEDITEKPFRVDRMLTTLRLAGALRDVAAVVIGDFTQCDPGPDGVTVESVLRERFGDLGVPVLIGAPFGHGAVNRPWVCGARVRVDAGDGRVEFLEGLAG